MKRNLFVKILFSYLVIVCLSFFILDLLIKDEIKKVMTDKIETELLSYAELIDLNSAQDNVRSAPANRPDIQLTGYSGRRAGQGVR